jgi:predicted Fe-S protein YdhL (DUF1289 family)
MPYWLLGQTLFVQSAQVKDRHNKISNWLNKLDPDEKKDILDRARQLAPEMKKKHLMKEIHRL